LGSKVSLIALDEIPDVCSSSFFDKVSQMGPSSYLGVHRLCSLGATCRGWAGATSRGQN